MPVAGAAARAAAHSVSATTATKLPICTICRNPGIDWACARLLIWLNEALRPDGRMTRACSIPGR